MTAQRHDHQTGRGPVTRDDSGITTAEYAVGTAAGAGLAGVLYQLVTGGFGDQMLRQMFNHVLGMLGIG
ncbi:DUF4244 domain-containing protein [Nocardioides sp. JQ2195]|uniref:DUF4244 domain-containing protein n=1 Tax=Nocardioides sp. JQ2195 TaxID=2592334 RepID=UPI00143E4749|nr:DUF4244 domain-containing protein [Nocardioides sp. JQ2195]QIX28233.1 DUF4244 domain-containing protein [Nocardioides sp. JQ2195]